MSPDWDSPAWDTSGFQSQLQARALVCQSPSTQTLIVPFPTIPKPFSQSVDFCHLLGGRVAVATSNAVNEEGGMGTLSWLNWIVTFYWS